MHIKQAAYIIGSLGGRPRTKPIEIEYQYRRGGISLNMYYTAEDGTTIYTDESGLNNYEVE